MLRLCGGVRGGFSPFFGWKKVVFVMLPVALHKPKGCDPGPMPATWLKGKRTLDGLRGAGGDWERPLPGAVLGSEICQEPGHASPAGRCSSWFRRGRRRRVGGTNGWQCLNCPPDPVSECFFPLNSLIHLLVHVHVRNESL